MSMVSSSRAPADDLDAAAVGLVGLGDAVGDGGSADELLDLGLQAGAAFAPVRVERGVRFCCAKVLYMLRLMNYITTHARRVAEQQRKEPKSWARSTKQTRA